MMFNLNEVERLLKSAVLSHLSEEELGAYHDNAVDEVTRARIEAHLDRCLICERKLAMMREVLATYDQEPIAEKDVALVRQLLRERTERTVAILIPVIITAFAAWAVKHRRRVGASFAGETVPQDGQTEDGRFRWRITENEWDELVVRFGSHHTELEGVTLLLKAGPIEKKVVLERKMKNQVGAEVTFTREERAKIPESALFTLDVVSNEN